MTFPSLQHRPLLLILSLALLLSACDFLGRNGEHHGPDTLGTIRFDDLQVGQESRYVRFVGDHYWHPDSLDFSYLGDTLVIEVIHQTDSGFVFQESLTAHSQSLTTGSPQPIHRADSVFTYLVTVRDDTLTLPWHDSHLFSWGGPFTLPLDPITDTQAEIRGWKTSLPYCECYQQGYVENYEQLGKPYAYLNLVIDDTPMQRDGPGQTFLYARDAGIVRAYVVSWWTQQGFGWDLLGE